MFIPFISIRPSSAFFFSNHCSPSCHVSMFPHFPNFPPNLFGHDITSIEKLVPSPTCVLRRNDFCSLASHKLIQNKSASRLTKPSVHILDIYIGTNNNRCCSGKCGMITARNIVRFEKKTITSSRDLVRKRVQGDFSIMPRIQSFTNMMMKRFQDTTSVRIIRTLDSITLEIGVALAEVMTSPTRDMPAETWRHPAKSAYHGSYPHHHHPLRDPQLPFPRPGQRSCLPRRPNRRRKRREAEGD